MTDQIIRQLLLDDTQAAADRRAEVKRAVMTRLPRRKRQKSVPLLRPALTFAACLLLALSLAVFTPQGRAFAAAVKESVTTLWQQLFPPKDITVNFEGMDVDVHHVPHIPAASSPAPSAPAPAPTEEVQAPPQFVIYVDEETYSAAWEEEVYVIRSIPVEYTREDAIASIQLLLEGLSEAEREAKIQAELERLNSFADSLPVRDLRIRHMAGTSPEDALEAVRSELAEAYSTVQESEETDNGRLALHAYDGLEWDSPVADVTLVDDGSGGVFVLTARYFLEATEGHGVRFAAMVNTFAVLTEESATQAPDTP